MQQCLWGPSRQPACRRTTPPQDPGSTCHAVPPPCHSPALFLHVFPARELFKPQCLRFLCLFRSEHCAPLIGGALLHPCNPIRNPSRPAPPPTPSCEERLGLVERAVCLAFHFPPLCQSHLRREWLRLNPHALLPCIGRLCFHGLPRASGKLAWGSFCRSINSLVVSR